MIKYDNNINENRNRNVDAFIFLSHFFVNETVRIKNAAGIILSSLANMANNKKINAPRSDFLSIK